MDDVFREILNTSLDPNHYEYGFAKLTGLLHGRYQQYNYGVSILRQLDDRIVDSIADVPNRAYFEHYSEINAELNAKVSEIAAKLCARGYESEAVTATVDDKALKNVYRDTLSFPVSHKLVATRAGLGWIGKTDLLISKRFGPRVRLASILTHEPLPDATPVDESQCGSCSLCVALCPAKAASGESWNVNVPREVFFNAEQCRGYCRKTCAEVLGEEISLCGRCVCVCPRGIRMREK